MDPFEALGKLADQVSSIKNELLKVILLIFFGFVIICIALINGGSIITATVLALVALVFAAGFLFFYCWLHVKGHRSIPEAQLNRQVSQMRERDFSQTLPVGIGA